MLALLSPAKRLEFDSECPFPSTAAPLLAQTKQLSTLARQLTASDLARLMKLSPSLAELNVRRFAEFKPSPRPSGSRPAVWAFDGDTYAGLRAREFSPRDMAFAQEHLGILSGLYGILRPLDAILPYRLEMGTKFKTPRGADLYSFWGDRIAKQITLRLKQVGSNIVVNLASQEYFAAVDLSSLRAQIIHPVFKERRGGALKIISFSAKRARGAMARYLVQQRATDPETIKKFRVDGYKYEKSLSTPTSPVFVRNQP